VKTRCEREAEYALRFGETGLAKVRFLRNFLAAQYQTMRLLGLPSEDILAGIRESAQAYLAREDSEYHASLVRVVVGDLQEEFRAAYQLGVLLVALAGARQAEYAAEFGDARANELVAFRTAATSMFLAAQGSVIRRLDQVDTELEARQGSYLQAAGAVLDEHDMPQDQEALREGLRRAWADLRGDIEEHLEVFEVIS
jgi:hypothetical protein